MKTIHTLLLLSIIVLIAGFVSCEVEQGVFDEAIGGVVLPVKSVSVNDNGDAGYEISWDPPENIVGIDRYIVRLLDEDGESLTDEDGKVKEFIVGKDKNSYTVSKDDVLAGAGKKIIFDVVSVGKGNKEASAKEAGVATPPVTIVARLTLSYDKIAATAGKPDSGGIRPKWIGGKEPSTVTYSIMAATKEMEDGKVQLAVPPEDGTTANPKAIVIDPNTGTVTITDAISTDHAGYYMVIATIDPESEANGEENAGDGTDNAEDNNVKVAILIITVAPATVTKPELNTLTLSYDKIAATAGKPDSVGSTASWDTTPSAVTYSIRAATADTHGVTTAPTADGSSVAIGSIAIDEGTGTVTITADIATDHAGDYVITATAGAASSYTGSETAILSITVSDGGGATAFGNGITNKNLGSLKINKFKIGTDQAGNVIGFILAGTTIYVWKMPAGNVKDAATNDLGSDKYDIGADLQALTGDESLKTVDPALHPVSKTIYILYGYSIYTVQPSGDVDSPWDVAQVDLSAVPAVEITLPDTMNDNKPQINDYTWSKEDNMLFISAKSSASGLEAIIAWETGPFNNKVEVDTTTNARRTLFTTGIGSELIGTTNAPIETLSYAFMNDRGYIIGLNTCSPGFSVTVSELTSETTDIALIQSFNMVFNTPLVLFTHDTGTTTYTFILGLFEGLQRIAQKYIDHSTIPAKKEEIPVLDLDFDNTLTKNELKNYGSVGRATTYRDGKILSVNQGILKVIDM